jgi:hypothetical protein
MATRITLFDWTENLHSSTDLEGSPTQDGLAFDPVRCPTCTLIQTANSIYLFRVSDPRERRGLLVGGALGEGPVNAYLVGTLSDANDASDDASHLRTGSRAVFDIESDGAWKRMITSRVTRLIERKFVRVDPSRPTMSKLSSHSSCGEGSS